MRFKTRIRFQSENDQALNPVVRHWILTLLVEMGGVNEFVMEESRFRDDNLAVALGLGHRLGRDEFDWNEEPKPKRKRYGTVRAELQAALKEASANLAAAGLPVALSNNIGRISGLVGLSDLEEEILEFAVMIHIDPLLHEAGRYMGEINAVKVVQIVARLLGYEEGDVRRALHPAGLLARSGLLKLERHGRNDIGSKFDLLSNDLADNLYSFEMEPMELLRDMVIASKPPRLTLEDYGQMQEHIDILLPYMKKITARDAADSVCLPGVNILLYGPPGVGKTQLVRLMAAELGMELFEVSTEDGHGDAVSGRRRIDSFRAAQFFLNGKRTLLLFDEMEDIFAGESFFSPRSLADHHKGWINRTLEENPVPTFWLSNSIRNLDPAFARRFTLQIEVAGPTVARRKSLLEKSCGDLASSAVISKMAEQEDLSPAVIEKTISVIRTIQDQLPPERVEPSLVKLVNDTLQAQRHPCLPKMKKDLVAEVYDTAFISASADLAEVAEGLQTAGFGRVCLYGPPGTGKTAWGEWLAKKLDKPIHIKRASDLFSKWVGGNEKNIARAFSSAEREGAILLIDEVDSFLQDRNVAQHSWEVSSVNEMLTQMESFDGIFIASTNLMKGVDEASLRRFDLKVEFRYLAAEQAWQMFCRYCEIMQLVITDEALLQHRLRQMQNLTPGDFAAVARQSLFRPIRSAATLVSALESECNIKRSAPQKGMGFLGRLG